MDLLKKINKQKHFRPGAKQMRTALTKHMPPLHNNFHYIRQFTNA